MSQIELLSVHIPKTAGTSFRTLLEAVYGFERVHTVYPEAATAFTLETEDELWLADSLALCRQRSGEPRVVHGHYLMTWYAERFPQAMRIAWLRNPVDRIASFYFMWREMDLWPTASPLQRAVRNGTLDLVDFASSPAMRDQVTSRFLGAPNGRGLAFIGLMERFDDDLQRLRKLLSWPRLEVPHQNVNQSALYRSRSISKRVRAEIERLNPYDMALFNAVHDGSWRAAA